MNFSELTDRFCLFALKHQNRDIKDLFNTYLATLSEDEINCIKELFMIVVSTAETARTSELQPFLRKELEGEFS